MLEMLSQLLYKTDCTIIKVTMPYVNIKFSLAIIILCSFIPVHTVVRISQIWLCGSFYCTILFGRSNYDIPLRIKLLERLAGNAEVGNVLLFFKKMKRKWRKPIDSYLQCIRSTQIDEEFEELLGERLKSQWQMNLDLLKSWNSFYI